MDIRELLAQYQAGKRDFRAISLDAGDNDTLAGASLVDIDLEKADLSKAQLAKADLSGANLSQADLRKADLSRAKLYHANLSGADLRGADLSKVFLNGVNLRGAKIDDKTQLDDKWRLVWEVVNQGAGGRDLSGADLSGANLNGANLRGADLHEADLSGADLLKADISDANFNYVQWGSGLILVIDAEDGFIELIDLILAREGYTVAGSNTGPDGLALCRQLRPDLVLLEINLPRMDGWSVFREMKADPVLKNIPVIIVTVRAPLFEDSEEIIAHGLVDYITKPWTVSRIRDAVKKAIAVSQQDQ